MFIGYQDELKVLIAKTREELENNPFISFTKIEEASFAEFYNGAIYTSQEELDTAKQEAMRDLRNSYLVEFVDPVVSNPLRWSDMTDEEKQVYIGYRSYLLDYTEGRKWWKAAPKTLEEWKQ